MMLVLLAESALRSIALGAAVGLGLWLLRMRSPQLRMTAWTGVLLASLALPALTPWLRITLPAVRSHDLVDISWARLLPAPAGQMAHGTPPEDVRQSAVDQQAGAELRHGADAGWPVVSLVRWRFLATAVYVAVAGFMLARLLLGWVLMWRVVRAARPAANRFAAGMDVRISDVVRVPLTFASTILLPPACAGWSARKLQAAMLHEGAHVAHGDSYVLLLAAVNRAVFWFNPLAWWLSAHLADLAEMVSDDTAVAGLIHRKDTEGGDRARGGHARVDYADVLVDMARNAQMNAQPLAASLDMASLDMASLDMASLDMARPGTVRRRVARILSMTAAPVRISVQARAAIAVAILPLTALSAVTIARGELPAGQVKPAAAAPADDRTGETAGPGGGTEGKAGAAAAAARLAEVAVRFRDQIPLPGGKDAAVRWIDELRSGRPDFDRMSPQLAARMHRNAPQLHAMLETLGPTQSIFFRGVAAYGLDVYGVKFAGGAAEVRIEIQADGIIRDAWFNPEGDGTLGGITGCAAETGLRAAEGTAPIRVRIFNRSGADLSLYSLDAAGQRVAEGVFADNRTMDVLTAVERPLVVSGKDGNCREIVLPGQFTRFYLVEARHAGAPHGPSATRRNTPVPGSDEVLKRYVDDVRRGAPDYEAMTPEIAAALRPRVAQQQEILSKLGAMRAMWFRGVNLNGNDMYGVQFANGTALWQIGFAGDGRIASLWIGP
jgi:hypothetical protein